MSPSPYSCLQESINQKNNQQIKYRRLCSCSNPQVKGASTRSTHDLFMILLFLGSIQTFPQPLLSKSCWIQHHTRSNPISRVGEGNVYAHRSSVDMIFKEAI